MGSRKKKYNNVKVDQNKVNRADFINFYTGLNPDEKIAFKSYLYCYGRMRFTLAQLLKNPPTYRPMFFKNAVEAGYTWMLSFKNYPSVRHIYDNNHKYDSRTKT